MNVGGPKQEVDSIGGIWKDAPLNDTVHCCEDLVIGQGSALCRRGHVSAADKCCQIKDIKLPKGIYNMKALLATKKRTVKQWTSMGPQA